MSSEGITRNVDAEGLRLMVEDTLATMAEVRSLHEKSAALIAQIMDAHMQRLLKIAGAHWAPKEIQ